MWCISSNCKVPDFHLNNVTGNTILPKIFLILEEMEVYLKVLSGRSGGKRLFSADTCSYLFLMSNLAALASSYD